MWYPSVCFTCVCRACFPLWGFRRFFVSHLICHAWTHVLFSPSLLLRVMTFAHICLSGCSLPFTACHSTVPVQEVDRVLCVGGLFLCISSGPVEPRRQDLNINQSHSWSVEPIALAPVDVLAGGDGPLLPLHLFVCKKKAEAAQ